MTFSPLSDALMSYLASCSHKWLAWQIEENEKSLIFSLLYKPQNQSPSKLIQECFKLEQSPSLVIEEIFEQMKKKLGKEADSLPQARLAICRNSLGLGTLKS